MTDRDIAQIRIATPDDARAEAWAKIMQEPRTERSTVVFLLARASSCKHFTCSSGAGRTIPRVELVTT